MSERMVPVTINLPEKLFYKLAAVGEKFDMRVPELLLDMALVAIRRMPAGDIDPVVTRWRKGWPDKRIAADLQMTNLAVATRRRSYGLPANSLRAQVQIERVLQSRLVA